MASDYLSKYQGITQDNSWFENQTPSMDDPFSDSYDPAGSWDQDYPEISDTEAFSDEAHPGNGDGDIFGDSQIDDAFGGPPLDDPENETWNGNGLEEIENPGSNNQVLDDRQQRLLARIERLNKEVSSEYQDTRNQYDALLNGEGDLTERETQMKEVEKALAGLERDFKKLDEKSGELEKDGIDVEGALSGNSDDLLTDGGALPNETELDTELVNQQDLEDLKNEIHDTQDELTAERGKVDAAQAAKEEQDKIEAQQLTQKIQDARGYLTGDKDRYYWTGNASNGGKHIYDYYETDQKYARDTMDQLAKASSSGNWDGFTHYLETIPTENVDNVGALLYAIFSNHYPDILEKLPSQVLTALAEQTARGSVGSKQDTYYIDASGGNYDSPGDNKRRRGNRNTGIGPGTAAEGFQASAEIRAQQETEAGSGEFPPETPPMDPEE